MDAAPFSSLLATTFAAAYVLMIFVAPIILGVLCFQGYIVYKRNEFIHNQPTVLLEIKLPQEMLKSPLAMELFLTALYQTKGEGTWIARLVHGKVRPWFSLELMSDGGVVKFYIWTWTFWRQLIETQLYSQFPNIEVNEAKEDYALKFHFNPNKNDLFGCDFILDKPDCYPIKSYADYQLDKDPKEEFKIDPMTPVFEYLAGLRPGEQAWIQIIIRAHKKELPKHGGGWFEKADWTDGAKHEIDKIKNKDTQQVDAIKLTGLSLTKGEKDKIEAIERNISKIPFDCGVRVIYLAEKNAWNDFNVAGLTGSFRQYNAPNLNSFKSSHATDFDFFWQDFTGKKLLKKKHHMLEHFQHRHFFHPPHPGHKFVMNTESLATIYHFPGQVAKSGAIQRVEAKKAEPPANLPV
ncbi:MAG: hypothetical protein WC761_04060 [Candidatus Paceibacterota bacterium]|jgi:hypothetical protein